MSPKPRKWRPKTDERGKLRIDSLDEASRKDIKEWMKARLSRRDPFFQEHPDDLSSPQELFVQIWTAGDPRVRRLIEQASAQLLQEFLAPESGSLNGKQVTYLKALFRLLAGIRPIGARDLLESAVRTSLYQKPEFAAVGLDRFFVAAYAALGHLADEKLLERLLGKKKYAVDAFWGFALRGRQSAAKQLPKLLTHFRKDSRSPALSGLLFHLNERFKEPKRQGIEVLLSHLPDLPDWARGLLAESCATVGIELPVPAGDWANGYQRLSSGELARLDARIRGQYPTAILPESDPPALRAWMGQAA